MPNVVRPVTYTGTIQRLVVNELLAGEVTVELWGGGGGGGGNNEATGGSGGGSGYSQKTFSVVPGDVIDVAVGGGGSGGLTQAFGGTGGGAAGPSYIATGLIFNSRNPPAGPAPVYPQYNGAYVPWLNTYGVWEANSYEGVFDRTYTFTAPVSTNYVITSSCDNYGYVYIDGSLVLNVNGFRAIFQATVSLSAGTHTIRTQGINTDGPGSMGTTVVIDTSVDIINTRTTTGDWGSVATPVSYPNLWYSWMNDYAVLIPADPWTYTVNFPESSNYIWQIGADYGMTVQLDGTTIATIDGYIGSYYPPSPYEFSQYVTAGTHTVKIIPNNDGGTAGFALLVQGFNPNVFSGGAGGNAGPAGASGGGGGGGGATVVFLNNTVIAVAAGGGGGGGAGRSNGESATGGGSREAVGINNGQNGQAKDSDGGGGGGGGGGWGGGNGGAVNVAYDLGAYAGSAAGNLGDVTAEPVGRNPGVVGSFGAVGRGGVVSTRGTNGMASFNFNVNGLFVKSAGSWSPVQGTYVKQNGQWQLVKDVYVRQNGQWQLVEGAEDSAPNFVSIGDTLFGIDSRTYPPPPVPPPDPPPF